MKPDLLVEYLKARSLNMYDSFTVSSIDISDGLVSYKAHNTKCRQIDEGVVQLWDIQQYMFETMMEK